MTSPSLTKFTYLGHSTILIESPGGKRLLIDPWTTGNPRCPEHYKAPEALGKLDAILITHFHDDHIGDVEAICAANPETPVVGMFEGLAWLTTLKIPNIEQNIRPMNKGGSQRIADIEVIMTHAVHSSSIVKPDGTIIYAGEPAGFILRMEDDLTIFAAGDTALFGDMALLNLMYRPTIALLPIGDHYTMGPKQASHAIRLLGVSHVLPIHYATFPDLTGTPEELAIYAKDIAGLTIHTTEPGESFHLAAP